MKIGYSRLIIRIMLGMESHNNNDHNHRLFLIDIMKIVCAFLIFARHSITMFGCTYGYNTDDFIISMTSPVMTCFFIMSGFSIHYQHRIKETTAIWTREYLKKRLISILPSYFLVVAIWPLFNKNQLKEWAVLLPIDILGIQTTYRTLFGILHNGGTWFVSCLLLAYISYPVVKSVLEARKKYISVVFVAVLHFIMMYSYAIIPMFELDSLYSNPIARTFEFIIGVAYCELIYENKGASRKEQCSLKRGESVRENNFFWGGWSTMLTMVVISLTSIAIAFVQNVGIRTMFFRYLVTPIICVLLLASAFVRIKVLEKSRLLGVMSGISYQFFLMQLFLWVISAKVMIWLGIESNQGKIVLSLLLCIILSYLVWHVYDKPIRKYLNKIFL